MMPGECECGCGTATNLIVKDDAARGLFKGHYRRFAHGHNRRTATPIERIMARIDTLSEHACWIWPGAKSSQGYGQIGLANRKKAAVHRVTYEHFVGPIAEGLELDHLCRVRDCCNPLHLEPVTRRENCIRGISPAAQLAKRDRCHRGHLYTPENTRVYRGSRQCRKCGVINVRIYRERKAVA